MKFLVTAAFACFSVAAFSQLTTKSLLFNENRIVSGARNWAIRQNNSAEGDFQIGFTGTNLNATLPDFYTNPGDAKFTIKSNGNIGIGTTSVDSYAKLSISSVAIWNLKLSNTESGGGDWRVGSSSSSWSIGGGKFAITNTDASVDAAFVIDNNRNVGIGKVSPGYKLDVNGTINASAFLVNGTPIGGPWIVSGSNLNYTTGMISIGTTSSPSGYKLAVGGKIVAEEVVVKLQSNWPDYVFNSDFKLMPLPELASYIRIHRHLPGIPSASEVQKDGIQIGEMNAKLLQKIEELTLHIIELEKRMQELENNK